MMVRTGLILLRIGTDGDLCEGSNEPPGSLKALQNAGGWRLHDQGKKERKRGPNSSGAAHKRKSAYLDKLWLLFPSSVRSRLIAFLYSGIAEHTSPRLCAGVILFVSGALCTWTAAYPVQPHFNANNISGTKFEPSRRTNCGQLLDMSSGDVQPARYHKDVISNMNCEFGKCTITQYPPQKHGTNPPHMVASWLEF
ncbi:hypothetical protein ANN_14555 [Periplaneta americana]|uniref:Uncharacterized protein n=1 Tax=Periplaneta americana TaxID=6978 RepID=A0ABQ8SX97_PERAM|nr:hypothetical protein ANN_14555 [Periplaneta americana]